MSLDLLSRHGATALKEAQKTETSNLPRENIWFEWGERDEHVIRLVGDFKWIKTHWIGESKFGKDIPILNSSAFKGDNKIPMSVACGNWDVESESEDPAADNCPVCRLSRNADMMLKKYGADLTEADKEILKKIRSKCAAKSTYVFKCIDRDNPYVDDAKTKKGFKIIKMTYDLFSAVIELSKKMNGVSIISEDEGIDITIKRSKANDKGGGKYSYSVLPVMNGMTVKQTPLSDEERAYHDIDLAKFAGKPIDKERFEEELMDENNVRTCYEQTGADDGGDSGDKMPF